MFTLTVRPQVVSSEPPTITSVPLGPCYVDEEWSYQITATDPENDAITFWLIGENETETELDNGLLPYTAPTAEQKKFTVRAKDAHGAWTEQTFTLNFVERQIVNEPPRITSIPTGPVTVGQLYEYQVNATDPENDTLAYAVDTNSVNAGITVSSTGLLTWTPTAAGTQLIQLTVTDTAGNTTTQQFELGINPAPVVWNTPVITSTPTGPAYVGQEWSYVIETSDNDEGDTITYELVTSTGEVIRQLEGGILAETWTEAGQQTIIVRATDSYGLWTEQSFVLNVVEAPVQNDAPIFTSIPTGPAYTNTQYRYELSAQTFDGSTPAFALDSDSINRGTPPKE